MSAYASPWPIIRGAADAFRPPRRVSVSQGAAQSLVIRQPGGYSGPWSADETPYMTEPMDMLSSRRHEAVCFVGPARTGKTMGLLDAWISYGVTCDPGDMLIVQMSQDKARDFSKTRVDRAIRHSPALREMMSTSGHDDNTHDKMFRHGMWLKLGWPSASQLSGSDYRYVGLTDYDRMPDDIDGEGSAYALGLKRTQTFLSRGMCMVESSPGRDLATADWRSASSHEAPPVNGVLGIYNRSDRRRWFWRCDDCGQRFEAAPGLSLFATLPSESDLLELVRAENLPALAEHHAQVVCPCCGAIVQHDRKYSLNKGGLWLPAGCHFEDGHIVGEPMKSAIAGYWLGGVAAAYQSWQSIVLRYLQGLREYVMTGAEEALKSTTNTDQGMPYLPRHLAEAGQGAGEQARAEALPRYFVPSEARFLIAAVDIQGGTKSRFVVQVHAVGAHLEQWLVDRYQITESPRGDGIQIDPAGYAEDWSALTDRVVNATYRMHDGQELRVLLTVVDSGGETGTTANAYAWFRKIRAAGLSGKVMLVKGGSHKPETPVAKANARDASGQPMRDVTLYLLDTDYFKDLIAATRRRAVPGPGYMHLPDWLHATWYDELNAEVRGKNGKWVKVRARNEALDLWVYVLAACWKLGANKLNWSAPPAWAKPLSENIHVTTPEERRESKQAATAAAPSGFVVYGSVD